MGVRGRAGAGGARRWACARVRVRERVRFSMGSSLVFSLWPPEGAAAASQSASVLRGTGVFRVVFFGDWNCVWVVVIGGEGNGGWGAAS